MEKRFKQKYGMNRAEMKEVVKPLFLWMYDHGVQEIHLSRRQDKKALLTIDGVPL